MDALQELSNLVAEGKLTKEQAQQYIYNMMKKNGIVKKRKKIGRNEPCPGGCGKKYKKCACPSYDPNTTLEEPGEDCSEKADGSIWKHPENGFDPKFLEKYSSANYDKIVEESEKTILNDENSVWKHPENGFDPKFLEKYSSANYDKIVEESEKICSDIKHNASYYIQTENGFEEQGGVSPSRSITLDIKNKPMYCLHEDCVYTEIEQFDNIQKLREHETRVHQMV